MVTEWLAAAMASYNAQSLDAKDGYAGQVHLPGALLEAVLSWAFRALPNEILVGFDADESRPHHAEVESRFRGAAHRDGLFAGQGFVLADATFVNQGDSYSVHHVPEDWTDGIFSQSRGPRGGRFLHWMHTHPNAVAIPSGADADAAAHTHGIDMILGIEFSPAGPLPWFDDIEGVRRRIEPGLQAGDGDGLDVDAASLAEHEQRLESGEVDTGASRRRGGRHRRRMFQDRRPTLGIAPTGHRIHGIELISFHRSGLGINVIFVDDEGWPYGWERLKDV